jgi:hypothetical protein
MLARALATARAAYELCAKKTKDPNVAVAATNAAASIGSLLGSSPPKARCGDRLRLEWLAVMHDSDERLLVECARILSEAIALSAPPLRDRIRLASAEAHSLALAIRAEASWRPAAARVAFLSL